jgi:hypothetical protein
VRCASRLLLDGIFDLAPRKIGTWGSIISRELYMTQSGGRRHCGRDGPKFTAPSLTPPFRRMSFGRSFGQKKTTQSRGLH